MRPRGAAILRQRCHKKHTSVSTEAGIGAKESFSQKPGSHAHQTNTLREMTQLVRQPTVGGTSGEFIEQRVKVSFQQLAAKLAA